MRNNDLSVGVGCAFILLWLVSLALFLGFWGLVAYAIAKWAGIV